MQITEEYKLGLRAWRTEKGQKAIILHSDKVGFFIIPTCKFIEPKYDKIWFFREGRADIELNGKEGYVDLEGNEFWD